MKNPHTVLADLKDLAADPRFSASLDHIVKDLESLLPKTVAQRFEGIAPLMESELMNRFTYHAPKPGQPEIYGQLRNAGLDLAILVTRHVPPGREQSSALTKIEESIFWANAGVARHGK